MSGPFAALLDLVVQLDRATVELVVGLRHPVVTKVMTSVTGLGSASAALVFLALFHRAGWREEFYESAVALITSGAVVFPLMALVARPYPPQPVCATGGVDTIAHSLPSGHAAVVTVFAAVAYWSDRFPFPVVASGALLIALSRVYLGTHYLSDTVLGVAIGLGSVAVARGLLRSEWFRKRPLGPER
jgi:undecaprenyl-diphosphatase